MDGNLVSPHTGTAHDPSSRHKDHVNDTSTQSTPFLQTDYVAYKNRHASISGVNSPEKEGSVPQVRGWPDTACRLKRRTAWGYLSLLWAVILTFSPVIFLGKSPSNSQALGLLGLTWTTNHHESYRLISAQF